MWCKRNSKTLLKQRTPHLLFVYRQFREEDVFFGSSEEHHALDLFFFPVIQQTGTRSYNEAGRDKRADQAYAEWLTSIIKYKLKEGSAPLLFCREGVSSVKGLWSISRRSLLRRALPPSQYEQHSPGLGRCVLVVMCPCAGSPPPLSSGSVLHHCQCSPVPQKHAACVGSAPTWQSGSWSALGEAMVDGTCWCRAQAMKLEGNPGATPHPTPLGSLAQSPPRLPPPPPKWVQTETCPLPLLKERHLPLLQPLLLAPHLRLVHQGWKVMGYGGSCSDTTPCCLPACPRCPEHPDAPDLPTFPTEGGQCNLWSPPKKNVEKEKKGSNEQIKPCLLRVTPDLQHSFLFFSSLSFPLHLCMP